MEYENRSNTLLDGTIFKTLKEISKGNENLRKNWNCPNYTTAEIG